MNSFSPIFTYNFTFVFASEDGTNLKLGHFGDSNRFYVYEINENGTTRVYLHRRF